MLAADQLILKTGFSRPFCCGCCRSVENRPSWRRRKAKARISVRRGALDLRETPDAGANGERLCGSDASRGGWYFCCQYPTTGHPSLSVSGNPFSRVASVYARDKSRAHRRRTSCRITGLDVDARCSRRSASAKRCHPLCRKRAYRACAAQLMAPRAVARLDQRRRACGGACRRPIGGVHKTVNRDRRTRCRTRAPHCGARCGRTAQTFARPIPAASESFPVGHKRRQGWSRPWPSGCANAAARSTTDPSRVLLHPRRQTCVGCPWRRT